MAVLRGLAGTVSVVMAGPAVIAVHVRCDRTPDSVRNGARGMAEHDQHEKEGNRRRQN